MNLELHEVSSNNKKAMDTKTNFLSGIYPKVRPAKRNVLPFACRV